MGRNSKTLIRYVNESQFGICCYCGDSGNKLTVDHIIPKSLARRNTDLAHHIDNITGVCGRCNNKKGTKQMIVFLAELAENKMKKSLANTVKVV
jgi:5-methylcytosine-specific restriction endonuclease McrA